MGAFIALYLPACGGKKEANNDSAGQASEVGKPAEGAAAEAPPTSGKPASPEKPAPSLEPAVELTADPGGSQGQPGWAHRIGGLGKDTARDIAVDRDGNVAIAGYFSDGADLGDRNPVAARKVDAYVAKYSAKGEHLWTVHFGGKEEDLANAVAFDPQGNAIVVGHFGASIEIGGVTLTSIGSDDAFMAKLDPDGTVLWARKLGGMDSDAAYDVAVSSTAIVITGSFKGTIKAADITLKSEGNEDIFLLALDSQGDMQWVRQYGFRDKDYGQQVLIDSRGHIVLLTEFSTQISFGGATLEAEGNRDAAVAKLDAKGGHIWSRRYGNVFGERALGLTVDPAGNIAFAGSFEDEIDFGGGTMSSKGESDLFVVKLDPAGNHVWSKSFGAARKDLATAIAADMYGNVAVGGLFWHKVDFGGGALEAPNGNTDAFLIKLSAKGDHLWSKRLGDRDHDQLRGVAIGKDGVIAACGIFRFTLLIGDQSLESTRKPDEKAPHPDAFVATFGR